MFLWKIYNISLVADPGFPRGGGVNFPGGRQHMILPNVPKNCMKLKKFGPGGGGCVPCGPLRSATVAGSRTELFFYFSIMTEMTEDIIVSRLTEVIRTRKRSFPVLCVSVSPPYHYRPPPVCRQPQPIITFWLAIATTWPSVCFTKTTCCIWFSSFMLVSVLESKITIYSRQNLVIYSNGNRKHGISTTAFNLPFKSYWKGGGEFFIAKSAPFSCFWRLIVLS